MRYDACSAGEACLAAIKAGHVPFSAPFFCAWDAFRRDDRRRLQQWKQSRSGRRRKRLHEFDNGTTVTLPEFNGGRWIDPQEQYDSEVEITPRARQRKVW
jgi:hypothetical protein